MNESRSLLSQISMDFFTSTVYPTCVVMFLSLLVSCPVTSRYPMCTERGTWLTMGEYRYHDAVDTCIAVCRVNSSLTFSNVRRQGPAASYAECYCSDTRLETSLGGCSYECDRYLCGGDEGKHSVYPVCPLGNYRFSCEYNCPGICKDGVCQRTTGECLAGCLSGSHGVFCNKTCGNCASVTCDQYDAVCLSGCLEGWYTPQCTEPCPEHCNGSNKVCEQNTGGCLDGCEAGWYTSQCTEPCPGYCNLTSCGLEQGECEDGCKGGYYGMTCEESCSTNCSEAGCTQDSGLCHSCRHGHFGQLCDIICPENCVDMLCEMTGGSCTHGCEPGWCGEHCNTVVTTDGLSTPAWIGICVTFVAIIVGLVITIILLVKMNRISKNHKDGMDNPSFQVPSRQNNVDAARQTRFSPADNLEMSGVSDINDKITTFPQYQTLKHDETTTQFQSPYEELESVEKVQNVSGVIYEGTADHESNDLSQRKITLPDTYDSIEGVV